MTKATVGGRSCVSCPSFLADNKQRDTMGGDISGPICGSKMLPLIMPTQPKDAKDRAFASIAGSCDSYGKQVSFSTMSVEYAPALSVGGDAESISAIPDLQQNARCGDCTHYVRSADVHEKTGWTASLCRAQGSLMLDNKLPYYARTCGQFKRHVGPKNPRMSLEKFVFLPTFSPTFGKIDLVAQYLKSFKGGFNPTDYQTDREVTARHTERGIRAWRRIADPEGYGADTYLPIYDP